MQKHDLVDLLALVVERGASDLHLTVGAPPTLRVAGVIQWVSEDAEVLTAEDTRNRQTGKKSIARVIPPLATKEEGEGSDRSPHNSSNCNARFICGDSQVRGWRFQESAHRMSSDGNPDFLQQISRRPLRCFADVVLHHFSQTFDRSIW